MKEVAVTIEILESYHHNGGTFIIPVEVINDVEGLLTEQQLRINKAIQDIETKEKNDDNWIDYELLIEPSNLKNILKGKTKWKEKH